MANHKKQKTNKPKQTGLPITGNSEISETFEESRPCTDKICTLNNRRVLLFFLVELFEPIACLDDMSSDGIILRRLIPSK